MIFRKFPIAFVDLYDISSSGYADSSVSCATCNAGQYQDQTSNKNRTKYKCVQCSSVALKASDIVYLHPECFGEYHRRKYRTVLGSSNVKGLVIGT